MGVFFILGGFMLFNWERIRPWIPYLSEGITVTLSLAVVSAVLGLSIGMVVNVLRNQRGFKGLTLGYVDLFRGTPLLLQLSMIYYAIPRVLSVSLNGLLGTSLNLQLTPFQAAIITFALNSGAYVSEIVRSGISSIPKGEIEAATSLGVSRFHIYKDILLPVGLRNSFPALINELITLTKESSIVSLIGLTDLMRRQQIVTAQTFLYFEPLLIIGIIYYTVVKVISITGRLIERRLNHAYREASI
jgi:arginine/lysine/histidine transport system permease protein